MSQIDGNSFCGDPFWFDNAFGANSTGPVFTWCFQHSALASLPTLFLIILLPISFLEVKTSNHQPIRWNRLTSAKLVRQKFLFLNLNHF